MKILDLFCGGGGAAMGYMLAAKKFDIDIQITGVDINHQLNYPFKFVCGDAIEFLLYNHSDFDFIHASPPCQFYSKSTSHLRLKGYKYTNETPFVRQVLERLKKPSVIENVLQAPIRPDIKLRGDLFGLKVIRERKFQLNNFFLMNPIFPKIKGSVLNGDFITVAGHESRSKKGKKLKGFENKTIKEARKFAMNVGWMTGTKEIAEAIPPQYTQFIFENYLHQI
jgi:DNA (cytosine-5)-methyltransferase 1